MLITPKDKFRQAQWRSAFIPSPGTPGEASGSGDRPRARERGDFAREMFIPQPAPTLTLPRSTGRGDQRSIGKEPRGLTLPELMVGLCIMAIVMGAMGAFTMALGTGWRQSELIQDQSLSETQVSQRIQALLRDARLYGFLVPGRTPDTSDPGAALIFWMNDADGDNAMKQSELGLLEHDPDDQTLRFYRVVWPANFTEAQKLSNDQAVSYATFNGSSALGYFKALPYVSSVVLARHVTGLRMEKHGVALPSISSVLIMDRDGRRDVLAGSATIRAYNYAPTTQP